MTRPQQFVLVVAVVLGLAAALFLMLRPMPWQELAIRSEEALFDARGERLRGYFHPEELRALGITEDVAIGAINEVLSPDLAGLEPDRRNRKFSEVEAQYLMSIPVSQGDVKPFDEYVEVTMTDKGPRVLLGSLIGTTWNMVVSSIGKENESVWKQRLADQGRRLKAMGINGYWHIDSNQIDEWPTYPPSDPPDLKQTSAG